MTIPAFPLQWPQGWPRKPGASRIAAKFSTSRNSSAGIRGYKQLAVSDGVERIRKQLDQMGVRDYNLVISTNLKLRLDGWPRGDQPEPSDPGVAVYWRAGTKDDAPRRCMAIDRYYRVADNLAAIAATLEAMRAIERHGGAEILDRAFTGFAALPNPAGAGHWTSILDVPPAASADDVNAQYRRLRSLHHPDRGGNADQFGQIQRAFEQAQAEGRA